ncbi:uncharacterized protein LOC130140023 [Syzygium oleosum]|uniref:uncharacterized protein LOC130140023 n=1 Tax=Syzygium oleosum TaxID=219896 RepID=UPI0024BB997F|nr:uncharacterized protein LOC130140023 [Syzygium oleosum]
MEDLGFKRLMAMAAMLVLILGASAAQVQSDNSCFDDCISDCADSRIPGCYAKCVAAHHCHHSLSTLLGHCELGCKITKCIGLRSVAKELGVCANACSKDCKATYNIPH